ncbi:DUF397 domain-containing protein [Actinomadura sp. DC4]
MKSPDLPTPHWRKSTYSGAEGGDCIEVALLAPHAASPEVPRTGS